MAARLLIDGLGGANGNLVLAAVALGLAALVVGIATAADWSPRRSPVANVKGGGPEQRDAAGHAVNAR